MTKDGRDEHKYNLHKKREKPQTTGVRFHSGTLPLKDYSLSLMIFFPCNMTKSFSHFEQPEQEKLIQIPLEVEESS